MPLLLCVDADHHPQSNGPVSSHTTDANCIPGPRSLPLLFLVPLSAHSHPFLLSSWPYYNTLLLIYDFFPISNSSPNDLYHKPHKDAKMHYVLIRMLLFKEEWFEVEKDFYVHFQQSHLILIVLLVHFLPYL